MSFHTDVAKNLDKRLKELATAADWPAFKAELATADCHLTAGSGCRVSSLAPAVGGMYGSDYMKLTVVDSANAIVLADVQCHIKQLAKLFTVKKR